MVSVAVGRDSISDSERVGVDEKIEEQADRRNKLHTKRARGK
jgi:hypothetical protein